jgi:uncharacterized protein (DUF952 family)
MGFHVEVNNILRSDVPLSVEEGQSYEFRKTGSRIFFDDIPIWLTRMDWTAVAEIQLTSQTRSATEVYGTYRVLHAYAGEEQAALTAIFRRMYSFPPRMDSFPGQSDPYFYLLESAEILASAQHTGFLVRDDLIKEGFIHASPAEQLTRVANKYYKAVKALRCAVVAKRKVLAQVKYEPATAGVYPHIYGPLNMDAVELVVAIQPKADGTFDINISQLLGHSG